MRRLAALLAVAAVAGGARHPPQRFGIVAFDLRAPVPQKLAELGVGLVRGSCGWDALEPSPGVFAWDCADNVIAGAAALDLRSYLTVTCTPAWANRGAGCAQMPDAIGDWYDFVARFVARYATYRPVLGIWNEPNLTLAGTADGRNYALLYVNASRARDATDPTIVLAGPETSHHAVATGYYAGALDAIRASGGLEPQDIVAVHWYPDGPPFDQYLDDVHAIAGDRDVWLTETGIATPDAGAQAAFYDQMLTRFLSPARPWWWTHLIFYRLWDGERCCTAAILTSDYQNTPAFDLYRDRLAALAPPERPPRRQP